MIKHLTFLSLVGLSISYTSFGQNTTKVIGIVEDKFNQTIPYINIYVEELGKGLSADEDGVFNIDGLKEGNYTFIVSGVGYKTERHKVTVSKEGTTNLKLQLESRGTHLDDVEVFGERDKAPDKLDAITRLPLKPSQQIQSISVISNKVIEEQGVLTITDAAKNVTGVTLFGSYGNVKESMSIRGYRGVPVLKNGIRMDSDFRTAGGIVDMQGVESIQVIKGSASITQGVGNDLGAAGGVINVVTKTPKFYNGGEVGLRVGSWGQIRPTFDVQSVLDKKNTVAFRLNGAFEKGNNFRPTITKESAYINPSLEWRPNEKTTIIAELDYLNSAITPDRGTVNMASDSVEALYKLPYDKFLGFSTDQALIKNLTYSFRMVRALSNNLSLRAVYFNSSYNTDQVGVGTLSLLKGSKDYNIRSRTLTRSLRDDQNATFQLDLMGKNVYTGSVKHNFQIGFDFRQSNVMTTAYNSVGIDTIDITKNFSNELPNGITANGLQAADPVTESSYNYGLMAQEVIDINKYITAFLGVRYSFINGITGTGTGKNTADNVDPMFGIMVRPMKNINLFASYTTTTSLRSANNIQLDKVTPVGPSRSKQFEAGIKSDWINNRLRFNFTYFNINNSNLSYTDYDSSGTATGFYGLGGDLKRTGIETELTGRVLENVQIIFGYAYLDARYENSPAYVEGSAPSNAPKHTANAWAQYFVKKGAFKNLSIGVGVYYVGERPVNEFTQKVVIHNTTPGVKPFDMPAYTTLNAQVGYTYKKVTARVLFNNITDALGYNAYYRGGYVNQISPRNFAGSLTYKF